MVRVIVADDEFFARKALVKRLQEMSDEVQICAEAEDGNEVMKFLKEQGADIVVTDIKMPDMDGLQVAKEISENFPNTSVIIESGYADFEYATTAIRYGVKDYLTKPVKSEDLEKAVRRIQEEKHKVQKQRGQFMDFAHILENPSVSREILWDFFKEMQSGSWYLVAAQSFEKQMQDEQIQKVLQIWGKQASYFYPKNEFILILKEKDNQGFSESQLRKKLLECKKEAGVLLSLGISQIHKKTENYEKETSSAYREAVYAINQRLLHPEQRIYTYEAEVNVKTLFSQAEERELEGSLRENKLHEAQCIVERLFRQSENGKEFSIYSLFASLIQIVNVINRVYSARRKEEGKSYLLFNFKTDLYAFQSMEELKKYIFQLLADITEDENPKSSIIEDLLKYLEWNYQYDITVNELAAHKYFVNPSYLSRLFKLQTGKTFSKYLIELRMQKAAKLLRESNLKISDVALCVGYNDVSYFIQTFKKYYFMTPEQYKK